MSTAVPVDEIREMRQMRRRGMRYRDIAQATGRNYVTVRKYLSNAEDKIPNDELRVAFLESGVSATQVAARAGWGTPRKPDGAKLKRTLGILADRSGNGRVTYRRRISRDTHALIARALCDEIGRPPHEVGL